MDPFRDDFNVDEAIASTSCPPCVQPFSNIDEFEKNLITKEPEIFYALMRIEDGDFKSFVSNNSTKLGCDVSKRERMKRLQNICIGGATPLIPKPVIKRFKIFYIKIFPLKQ